MTPAMLEIKRFIERKQTKELRMTVEIIRSLDALADLKAQMDIARIRMEAYIEEAMDEKTRKLIKQIKITHEAEIESLALEAKELEKTIKAAVITHGATVKANGIMATWNKPRTSWDTKGLNGYAVAHPEIERFRKTGKPSSSIRRR